MKTVKFVESPTIASFNALVEQHLPSASGKDPVAKRQDAIRRAAKANPELFKKYKADVGESAHVR